jgi:hypothetical protein
MRIKLKFSILLTFFLYVFGWKWDLVRTISDPEKTSGSGEELTDPTKFRSGFIYPYSISVLR